MSSFLKDLYNKVFSSKPSESPANAVDKVDLIKALRTSIIVGAAAVVSYLMTNLGGIDLGVYGPTVIPVVSFVLDMIYRWLKDNSDSKVK